MFAYNVSPTREYVKHISFFFSSETPMLLPVVDIFGTLSFGDGSMTRAQVDQPSWSTLQTQGSTLDQSLIQTVVSGTTTSFSLIFSNLGKFYICLQSLINTLWQPCYVFCENISGFHI